MQKGRPPLRWPFLMIDHCRRSYLVRSGTKRYFGTAAGAVLAATHANAGPFPVNRGLTGSGGDRIDQVAVRVYVHEGQRYCFYFNGWHGPGWYRCGYAFRRGLGWGGVYGWNSWSYGPYERRYGRRHYGEQIGVDSGARRMGGIIDSRTTRSSTGVETRSSTGVETRSRSTTGSGAFEGRARARGSAPNTDVQSEGGAKMQGGPTGEGSSIRGSAGGSMGTAPAGEGNPRR